MATVWIYVDTKKRAPDPGAKYYLSRFGAHDLGWTTPQTSDVQAVKPHCRTGFPLLENDTTRRSGCRAIRRVDSNSGSAWTISLSNSSTALYWVRSMA